MLRNRTIQIKAAFLILVFSFNTIIGFACAIGLDMGFNISHHQNEEAFEASLHEHADGKKHIHHEDAHKGNHKSTESNDDCCNGKVTKFSQLDKSVPQSLRVINPIFFTSFVATFNNNKITFLSAGSPAIKHFVRSHHPPIPDIRIAIQSFQI